MTKTLAIDLASRRYRDFGFALLAEGEATPQFPTPEDLGLEDPPNAKTFASALAAFCQQENVDLLLLDGPQGWRHPQSSIEHMRLCERVLNTPAKTGEPGTAKPGTMLRYVQFSIDLFQHLRVDHRWRLLRESWRRHRGRLAVEVYPSVGWSLLGLERLPGKSKAGKELAAWRQGLARVTGLALPDDLSHDQLQAAVVLPLGHAFHKKREDLVVLAGVDPIIEGDTVFEGLIASPRLASL